jgi:hypothetical protein
MVALHGKCFKHCFVVSVIVKPFSAVLCRDVQAAATGLELGAECQQQLQQNGC